VFDFGAASGASNIFVWRLNFQMARETLQLLDFLWAKHQR
jgi:hypothetical protein